MSLGDLIMSFQFVYVLPSWSLNCIPKICINRLNARKPSTVLHHPITIPHTSPTIKVPRPAPAPVQAGQQHYPPSSYAIAWIRVLIYQKKNNIILFLHTESLGQRISWTSYIHIQYIYTNILRAHGARTLIRLRYRRQSVISLRGSRTIPPSCQPLADLCTTKRILPDHTLAHQQHHHDQQHSNDYICQNAHRPIRPTSSRSCQWHQRKSRPVQPT